MPPKKHLPSGKLLFVTDKYHQNGVFSMPTMPILVYRSVRDGELTSLLTKTKMAPFVWKVQFDSE